jgi:RNA polymerase sigma-70 factor (ECF subfamily)
MRRERNMQEGVVLDQHRPALLAWFRRRLRDIHTAEDLCQETLVRFLVRGGRLADPEKTRPYLFRTARNLLVDHYRRRHGAGDLDLETAAASETLAAPRREHPETAAYDGEIAARLQVLLASLPPDLRDAFDLGVIQGLPYAEVARLKGRRVGKVKIDVYRARKALCRGLEAFRAS